MAVASEGGRVSHLAFEPSDRVEGGFESGRGRWTLKGEIPFVVSRGTKTFRGLVLLGLALIGLLLMVGCSTVNEGLLRSSEAFYDAVAVEYSGYVGGDPRLTTEQKANRGRTVRAYGWCLVQHRRLLEEQGGDK